MLLQMVTPPGSRVMHLAHPEVELQPEPFDLQDHLDGEYRGEHDVRRLIL